MEQLRTHTPKQELDRIEQSVQSTMDAVYSGQTFDQVQPAVQQHIVAQAVTQHLEDQLSQPIGNPFGDTRTQSVAKEKIERIALHLSPDEDDSHIHDLLELVQQVGVLAVLKAIEKTASYHIKDDLHRALVAYIHQGYPVKKLSERDPIKQGLSMSLFELYLPLRQTDTEQNRDLKQVLSSMEQFYAGMRSVIDGSDNNNYFSIEIALPQDREEIIIYAAVPDGKINIFKNQVLAIFPDIKLVEATDDYNIFNKQDQVAASTISLERSDLLPIRTYSEFDYDPLNVLLESFSNLEKHEGASVQIMIGPDRVDIRSEIDRAIQEIEEGQDPEQALQIQQGFFAAFRRAFGGTRQSQTDADTQKRRDRATRSDRRTIVEQLQKKNSTSAYACNIRLITAGNDAIHAQQLLSAFESAFHQFSTPQGNEFVFNRATGRKLQNLIKQFSFRIYDPKQVMYMTNSELTSILHFHKKNEGSSDLLSINSAITAGASAKTIASSTDSQTHVPGRVLLGNNIHQGSQSPIYLSAEDRLRHMYVIGQTGTGKTSILKNMIIQDIHNGEGVCFIDPHGSDIEDIMSHIPPHRIKDVIYFDPSQTERPMGMNLLDYDQRYPEQKSFVVNELMSIFNKLFDMKTAGGPMFEQYFRNATLLVMDDPASGNSLLDISRVLADANYRRLKLSRCTNVVVKQFWEKIAQQAGGEASLENIVPYITSKFDQFLGDEIMRPIVAQEQSAFNIRQVMDNKKILLVNLSKGRLGEINANLLGLIFVGKILMAALSRVDCPKNERAPFYLYIDEFQNVTTDSISQIFSEARKYGLSLNVAHQFIKQLDEGIRDAVFGNVGNIVTFRVSTEDADFLSKIHSPVFTAQDISNIDNYNAYVKMLVAGQPQKSFSLSTVPPTEGNPDVLSEIKTLSQQTYGRPRADVEGEILKKYQSMA